MSQETEHCLHCGQDSGVVPLIPFRYRGRGYAICSQHLPVLIHDPGRLVGQLPGAEGLSPAEHED
jgi:hypothetical protein